MSDIDKILNRLVNKVEWCVNPEAGAISVNREKEYIAQDQAKQAIKQLMVDELEKIIDFINTDTNDVCWKHSPDDTPMIHSSRVDYLKEYIEQKLEEWKK